MNIAERFRKSGLMAKIAVDVVLLPSDEMAEKAIAANKELLKQNAPEIVLDKESCLPHISLAMGCIAEKDIEDIHASLKAVARKNPLGRMRTRAISTHTNKAGEKISVLEIENTEALRSIHREVMQETARYFSYDVGAEMLLCGSQVSASTLDWIRNYREKSSFEKFSPHITIGYGQIDDFSFPTKFTASRLALCHLGNHCTCRKILVSTNLENRQAY
jgi:hypothetical protein